MSQHVDKLERLGTRTILAYLELLGLNGSSEYHNCQERVDEIMEKSSGMDVSTFLYKLARSSESKKVMVESFLSHLDQEGSGPSRTTSFLLRGLMVSRCARMAAQETLLNRSN